MKCKTLRSADPVRDRPTGRRWTGLPHNPLARTESRLQNRDTERDEADCKAKRDQGDDRRFVSRQHTGNQRRRLQLSRNRHLSQQGWKHFDQSTPLRPLIGLDIAASDQYRNSISSMNEIPSPYIGAFCAIS